MEGIATELETSVVYSLKSLYTNYPLALYNLIMKCRDDSRTIFPANVSRLTELGLLQGDGTVHDAIRETVLAHSVGEGLNVRLI